MYPIAPVSSDPVCLAENFSQIGIGCPRVGTEHVQLWCPLADDFCSGCARPAALGVAPERDRRGVRQIPQLIRGARGIDDGVALLDPVDVGVNPGSAKSDVVGHDYSKPCGEQQAGVGDVVVDGQAQLRADLNIEGPRKVLRTGALIALAERTRSDDHGRSFTGPAPGKRRRDGCARWWPREFRPREWRCT